MPAHFTFSYSRCKISIRPVPHPENYTEKSNPGSVLLTKEYVIWVDNKERVDWIDDIIGRGEDFRAGVPGRGYLFEGTGLRKMRQRFLAGGMCAGMCVAKYSNDKCPAMAKCFMPYFAGKYLRLRNASIFIKPWFFIRPLLIFKGAHEIASLSCLLFDQAKSKKNI